MRLALIVAVARNGEVIPLEIVTAAQERTARARAAIRFYPDGSATEAFLILANEREAGIEVQLRAMTGTASVGGVISLKDIAN